MPKQVFDGKRVSVLLDETIPIEYVEIIKRNYKGKENKLTSTDKIKLFDAYVDAEIINLDS